MSPSLDEAETALQQAQRRGDVTALDALLHEDVLYVGPDGALSVKAADLQAHRDGVVDLDEVVELERRTRVLGQTAGTTCVRLHLRGTAGGAALDAVLVYTRTWVLVDGAWRVVQAQAGVVPSA